MSPDILIALMGLRQVLRRIDTPFNPMIHKNAKVVPKERPGDTQRPGRGNDEELTQSKQHHRNDGGVFLWQNLLAGLVFQRQMVPEQSRQRQKM